MRCRIIALLLAATGVLCAQSATLPPTYGVQTRFNTGQDVVPSFEGWFRNTDGTYTMVFGYMNRNYQEEPVIAVGPDNKVEPGSVDQGQPTFFLPRRHAWVFFAKVPADFGNKELVWSITAHGRTEKAYGQLLMEEEILQRVIQSRGNLNPGLENPNKPPTLKVAPVTTAGVGASFPLNVDVSDDGLPKARVPKARTVTTSGTAQTNAAVGRRLPLNVTWMQYRGPAKAIFEPTEPVIVNAGKSPASVRFSQPGIYILRATANDGELQTTADVTVTVK